MGRSSREGSPNARPTWATLETWVRVKVQEFVQAVLEEEEEEEEEVTETLGRRRYERRDGVDAPVGHRNGYGKPRRLALQTGTIVVRRPRVRGLVDRRCRVRPRHAPCAERLKHVTRKLASKALVERVGGTRTFTVDVRVIAATNRDLEAECRNVSCTERRASW
jgi:putative transposase